jgi:hypothetical protein
MPVLIQGPEFIVEDSETGEDSCAICGMVLTPLYENTGFNEPGAEHQEFIGYKMCLHQGDA